MMRVALISPLHESVPPKFYGGTERVVHHLCSQLVEAGVDVTLFASGDSLSAGNLVPIVPEALRLGASSALGAAGAPDPMPYRFRTLSEVAARIREFDVIHNHDDYWMLPLSEMSRVPVLTTLHGQLDLPHVPIAFERFSKAFYVSISESQRRPAPHLNWVRTIHHGIDVHRFEFQPTPGNYLAFLGRMSPQKRPDLAIEIARRSGVPLKMAAKIDGALDAQYFEACVKPHIDGRFIEYIGEISEAEKGPFLGGALGLVFPIDWPEPFGLVMIEALACGTPVLARPCGAAAEVLFDGVTGYSSFDVNELACRVRDLPSLNRRQCRRWVEEKFSLTRMTKEYLHVYQRLAELSVKKSRVRQTRSDRHRWDLLYPLQRIADGNS